MEDSLQNTPQVLDDGNNMDVQLFVWSGLPTINFTTYHQRRVAQRSMLSSFAYHIYEVPHENEMHVSWKRNQRWGGRKRNTKHTFWRQMIWRSSCCGPSNFEKKAIGEGGKTTIKKEGVGDDKNESKKNREN